MSRQQTALGLLTDIRSKNVSGIKACVSGADHFTTHTHTHINTYCAFFAVSTAACKHPQTPACFTVFCKESHVKDTPSHFSATPVLWKIQSTALLQDECAALQTKQHKEDRS